MDFQRIIDRFQDEELLSNLSLEESKVFVELLLLTVYADGEITEEELEGLNLQWNQLPFTSDKDDLDAVGEHGYEFRQHIEGILDDDDAFDELLEDTASRLETDAQREAALRMVAIVAHADGVDPAEVEMTDTLGEYFGFDEMQVADIVDDIYAAPLPEDSADDEDEEPGEYEDYNSLV